MKKRVHFLYQNQQTESETRVFLESFYEVSSEPISFSLNEIKTKDLFLEIDKRLEETSFDFIIIQVGERLEMFDSVKRRIAIDFDNDHLNYSRKIFAKDPFLRAIGKSRERVLDITAGLGIDAVFLSQHGHSVLALERNPLLFLLLNQAQKHSVKISKLPIRFEFANASDFLKNSTQLPQIDCIYYDPMFPDKGKTALPKQEMVLFRQLVGNDNDSDDVLDLLLASRVRVVVKRPIGAPVIGGKPNNSFESKLIRYDIYEGR